MSIKVGQLSQAARLALRDEFTRSTNRLLFDVPKVELHVHIEGTLTPALRWKLAQRHGLKIQLGDNPREFSSLADLEDAHDSIPVTFFQGYYSGFEVLRTREDFFELAMSYFERAAAMNVRYCEPFFDAQGHTRRGVAWSDMMEGFREAQQKAARELNVCTSWTMCFLRDSSPESAMEHYGAALAYKDMIVGFGLDSNEYNRPPRLFAEVFALARKDGFRVTAHCDVGQRDTHDNIRQVAAEIGADRIDHGLNAADRPELVALVAQRGLGLTLCPWAYLRRETFASIGERMRALIEAGIRVCVSCDSPVYTDSAWIVHNLLLTQRMCGFTDEEMVGIVRGSVGMIWAPEEVKRRILDEIDTFMDNRK
ncbi:putative adenosine deaminase [Stachybotrys elegans]|uniref:Adenosine deaminase n=1 Tax=Stachybotrys elegans TaxID=80388 RepID=A0A8K0T3C7_9HYPO|nr:putative adenosine deaminase [Stachybotrys elegans]